VAASTSAATARTSSSESGPTTSTLGSATGTTLVVLAKRAGDMYLGFVDATRRIGDKVDPHAFFDWRRTVPTPARSPVPGSGRRSQLLVAVAAMVATALALVVGAAPSNAASAKPKHRKSHLAQIQLLTFNDFHGSLETGGTIPTSYRLNADGSPVLDSRGRPVSSSVEAGGAAYLAANLAKARKGHRYSITAAAGDLIGASPLVSAAFHDEPSIEALNDLGLEVSSVGNHEFDEGATELRRMRYGGCLADGDGQSHENSCPAGHSFTGAHFRYLSANVVRRSTGRPLFPPYWIKHFGHGIKIAFIGMTLRGTSDIVPAAAVAGLAFRDEVATANALVPQIKKQGVQSIVVLLHQGGTSVYRAGTTNPVSAAAPYNFRCDSNHGLAPDSPIISIAKRLNPAIDVIVSGHTHATYVCNIPDPLGRPRLVTSASSYGRLFTDIRLTYNERTGNIVRPLVTATNRIVTRSIKPDARVAALVRGYKALLAPIASRVIGQIAVPLPNISSDTGEVQLGDLIADAVAADPSVAGHGSPDVAFMNRRGVRGGGLTRAGEVTFGRAFATQPTNAFVLSMSLTGQQIIDLLNQQWSGPNEGIHRQFLQVSDGFSYRWQNTPSGPVLDESSVQIKGAPLVTTQTYRVAANDYLSEGGDHFTVFGSATDKVVGGLDIDALANYLERYTATVGPWAPPTSARITTF
jgi:2',3'-cyclic-nucleotide 2'-phosphodiesterase (5'-nucleotidase family)